MPWKLLWLMCLPSTETYFKVVPYLSELVLDSYISGNACGFTVGIGNTLGVNIIPRVIRYISSFLLHITQQPDFHPTFDTYMMIYTLPILWRLSIPFQNTLEIFFLSTLGTPWTRVYWQAIWFLGQRPMNENLSTPRKYISVFLSMGHPPLLPHVIL